MSPFAYSLRFHTSKSYRQPSTIIATIVFFTMVSVSPMNSSFTSLIVLLSSYACKKQELPRTAREALVNETNTCVIQALFFRPIYNLTISFQFQPPFLKVSLTSCLAKINVSDLFILTFCWSSICCLVLQQHLVPVSFSSCLVVAGSYSPSC